MEDHDSSQTHHITDPATGQRATEGFMYPPVFTDVVFTLLSGEELLGHTAQLALPSNLQHRQTLTQTVFVAIEPGADGAVYRGHQVASWKYFADSSGWAKLRAAPVGGTPYKPRQVRIVVSKTGSSTSEVLGAFDVSLVHNITVEVAR
jgi:hypothetical protein